jgi:signal transduction histidine kinase
VTVAAILCTTVVITPQYAYGKLLDVFNLAIIIEFVYAGYVIYKAWNAGRKDAKIICWGIAISAPLILIEITSNSILFGYSTPFDYMAEIGVLSFLMFQVYLNLNHYAKSFRKVESLNKNLEKIVQERTVELTRANRTKEMLLTIVSHDIKAPLNSLTGILNLFNIGVIGQNSMKDSTSRIEDELNRTGALVDNILFWTSDQLKGGKLNIEEFQIKKLLQDHIELFNTIAQKKKILIQNRLGEDVRVKADKNILSMVIRNMIANAIKFSHESGEIELMAHIQNDLLELKIKDNGIGMDDGVVKNLFDPEMTMSKKGTKNELGAGIGLALCNEYAKKMGSNIRVESSPGKGSTFYMTLLLAN